MRRFLVTWLACVLGVVAVSTQTTTPINDELPNPYQPGVRNWASLPGGRAWGSTAGIDIGPNGEMWAIDRCGANTCEGSTPPTVHQIEPSSGRVLRSIGAGLFVFPHGLHPDGAAGEGIAVDRDGTIYAAENTLRGITRYLRKSE